MSNFKVFIMSIISVFVLYDCAHQVAPSGGEEDMIPPDIVEFYPANGTVNFSENYFEITFSEYVQKSSVREAIFISPKIKGELDYSWSGKSLEVEFDEQLKPNTTYTVTIGTDVQDYNNRNKMAEPRTFVFSTGDKIDIGQISGRVYDKKPSGVMVYAYKEIDTLVNPMQQEPDYISQVGDNGKYFFKGLGYGEYYILAIRDDFRNYLYNVGEDDYGAPYKKVLLNETDSTFSDLDFQLTKEDTVPPNIISVTMTDIAHFLIEFSEYIDSSKINTENFFVYDSTQSQRHELKYFYKGTAKPKNLFVTIEDSLNQDNSNFIISKNLWDLHGNRLGESETPFVVNENPDTVAAVVKNVKTEFDNKLMDNENAWAEIMFDDGFDKSVLSESVGLFYEDKPVQISTTPIDNSTFIVKSLEPLKDNKEFKLKIDLSNFVDTKNNKTDSVYTIVLKTKNKLDYSGLSGKIENQGSNEVVVNLNGIENNGRNYTVIADSSGVYNFKRVVPGRYLVWSFLDTQKDSVYNYGKVFPFKSSERFIYYPDTLDLKPRWPVGDVELSF